MSHTHEHHDYDYDHDHDEEHSHDHDHSSCSPGEDYERNLDEQRKQGITRRQVLQSMGAAGLLIANGAVNAGNIFDLSPTKARLIPASQPYVPQGDDAFDGFYFISGDHHIHTRYSPDAKYAVQRQVAEANYHGLGWMVITDHGGATHNKIGVDLTYPDIVRAREAFPNMLIFAGLEMNIPAAEHGTVMVQPNAQEKDQLKQFEAAYDASLAPNTEDKAIQGLKFLDALNPKPLFFANHPSRRGVDSPHEIRNWKSAAPDVAYGFEGAPGHQAAGLIRDAQGKFVSYRGYYGNKPGTDSHPFLPLESYFTYGGFDWMTAKLGGLWDSLLGDGLRWWITANSDSHKYFNDLQDVDTTKYDATGYVSDADVYFQRPSYGDFRPGEYSRTYVVTSNFAYDAIMDAMRKGQIFVVQGDLIDRLKFTASVSENGNTTAVGLGGTLNVKAGSNVQVEIKVRVPAAPNWNNSRPTVDHIDLIYGLVNNYSRIAGLDNFTNPTTRVAETFDRASWRNSEQADGAYLTMKYTIERVDSDFYVRLRGTNTNDRGATPAMDPDLRGTSGPGESPWDDLWFYSNPIFVRITR